MWLQPHYRLDSDGKDGGRLLKQWRSINKTVLVGNLAPYFFIYIPLLCGDSRLHAARSYTSWQSLLSQIVFRTVRHLFFGLPLLLPCTSILIALFPTYSSSLLITCPYHRILRSWTFFEISPTFVVPPIFSFLILSNLVTPHIHRNLFISATSIFFSCAFFTAHVSAPYTILLVLLSSCIPFPSSWLSFFCHTALQTLSPSSSTHSELYGWLSSICTNVVYYA